MKERKGKGKCRKEQESKGRCRNVREGLEHAKYKQVGESEGK